MSLHVDLDIILSSKAFATQAAFIWFLTRVDFHVLPQFTGLGKASVAAFTLVAVLPRMPSLVHHQMVSSSEAFVTVRAFEGSFSCVTSQMNLQLTARQAFLSTEVALEDLASAMHHLPVVLQTSRGVAVRATIRADVQFTWPVWYGQAVDGLLVTSQVFLVLETFGTMRANIWSVVGVM